MSDDPKRRTVQEETAGRPVRTYVSPRFANLEVVTSFAGDKTFRSLGGSTLPPSRQNGSTLRRSPHTPWVDGKTRTSNKSGNSGSHDHASGLSARGERPAALEKTQSSSHRPFSSGAKSPELSQRDRELIFEKGRNYQRTLRSQAMRQNQERQRMAARDCAYYPEVHYVHYSQTPGNISESNEAKPTQYSGHIPGKRCDYGRFSPAIRSKTGAIDVWTTSKDRPDVEYESKPDSPRRHNICQYDMGRNVRERHKAFDNMLKRLAAVEREKKRLKSAINVISHPSTSRPEDGAQKDEKIKTPPSVEKESGRGNDGDIERSSRNGGGGGSTLKLEWTDNTPRTCGGGSAVSAVKSEVTNGARSAPHRHAIVVTPEPEDTPHHISISPPSRSVVSADTPHRLIISPPSRSVVSANRRPSSAPHRGCVQFPYKRPLSGRTTPNSGCQYPQHPPAENPVELQHEQSNNTRSYPLRKGVGIRTWGPGSGHSKVTPTTMVYRSGYGINNHTGITGYGVAKKAKAIVVA